MAGKNNAKSAEQAEPAKDAAMVEKTDVASEQTVTPVVLKVDGLGAVFDVTVEFPESKESRGGKVFCQPSVVTAEGATACDADELAQFMAGIDALFAGILAEAGVLVRKNGEAVPPTGENILAVSMKGEAAVVVTKDGRKFRLMNNGAINEAQ